MSDLFGNHIVGFPTRWLKYVVRQNEILQVLTDRLALFMKTNSTENTNQVAVRDPKASRTCEAVRRTCGSRTRSFCTIDLVLSDTLRSL